MVWYWAGGAKILIYGGHSFVPEWLALVKWKRPVWVTNWSQTNLSTRLPTHRGAQESDWRPFWNQLCWCLKSSRWWASNPLCRTSHRAAHKSQFRGGCGSMLLQTCFHIPEAFISTQDGTQGSNLYIFMCSVVTKFSDHRFLCFWAWNHQKNGPYRVEVTAAFNFVASFGWLSEMGPRCDLLDEGW